MRQWWRKLAGSILGGQSLADELHEEIEAHQEMEVQECLDRGMTPAEARRAAERRFGNRASIQERAVETWAFSWLEAFVRDRGMPPACSAAPRRDGGLGGVARPGYRRKQRKTLGMRLLAGRDFTFQDSEKAPRVVIVNESVARRIFPGEGAIGKRIGFGGNSQGNEYEIIGVVSDAKHITPRDQGRLMHYKPYRQDIGHLLQMCVAVRTGGDPIRLASRIRETLREVDPLLPVVKIETIGDQLDDLLGPERVVAALSGFLGVVALLLVSMGLYGLLSYAIARRTNEIGIRMALGATRARVVGMALGETAALVAAGMAIGLPATMFATRLIAARLFAVGPHDASTLGGAALAMLLVAVLATWLPVRRSARIDPAVALRAE